MRKHGLKIGLDSLVREMMKLAPHYEFFLSHQFGKWVDIDSRKGTRPGSGNVLHPFRRLHPGEAWEVWEAAAKSPGDLPGTLDIVHAYCFQAPSVAPAKLVYTVCDLGFWIHPELTAEEDRLLCQRGVLEAIGRAVGIVFISQSSLDAFERILPGFLEEKGIKHTVARLASRFEPVARPRATMPRGDWLAVGSLEPRKNYERILSAFERYCERSTVKRRLTIAGAKGWKSDVLRARIERLERQGLVKYEDYVDDERLHELYSGAFVLVFPSHYEGFGLPIVEAMSQGCPVITQKNSSLAEVGGSAAIYCDDADAEIAETMLRLERDEAYYLATSQASWAESSRFSWTATAGRVLELYEKLVMR
jgi:glycosyltransferase involved in cell wall biosynthesis